MIKAKAIQGHTRRHKVAAIDIGDLRITVAHDGRTHRDDMVYARRLAAVLEMLNDAEGDFFAVVAEYSAKHANALRALAFRTHAIPKGES